MISDVLSFFMLAFCIYAIVVNFSRKRCETTKSDDIPTLKWVKNDELSQSTIVELAEIG